MARQIMALGLALGVVALALAYPLRGYLEQQQAQQQAIAEHQQLQITVSDLRAHLAALQDPAYIKQEAKRRLQYVTPGETVYVVKVPGRGPDGTASSASSVFDGENTAKTDHDDVSAGATDATGDGEPDASEPPWYVPLWGALTGDDKR